MTVVFASMMAESSVAEIPSLEKVPGLLRWHACDLKTGRRLSILPLRGNPSSRIGDMTTVELSCDLADVGVSVQGYWDSTIPRRTLIVCERRYPNEATGQVIWTGIVMSRPKVPGSVQRLSCISVEGYFDHRKVGTNTWLESSPGDHFGKILDDLINQVNTLGIGLLKDISGFSVPRGYRTRGPEARSFLSVLQELMDMEGGPEWTVNGAWSADQLSCELTFLARPRLGRARVEGQPLTTFRYPGTVMDYETTDDHTGGNGANFYTVYRDGQGAATPSATLSSVADIAIEGKWEAEGTASGASGVDELQAAATGGLARRLRGLQITTFKTDIIAAPAVERDWTKGDDILLAIDGEDVNGNVLSYGHPEGVAIYGRAIGWEIDNDSNIMTPMLWTPEG